ADDDMPPPPEAFPPGWEEEWQPTFEVASLAARSEPVEAPRRGETLQVEKNAAKTESTSNPGGEALFLAAPLEGAESTVRLPSLYMPFVTENLNERPPRQITIFLRPSGDRQRDKRRIKAIYGTLISYHGRDRFSFQIFEEGKGHLIDFPNDTTRICPELLERLKRVMGAENWRVEEITLQ
ncbi:MAG: hypothetical protein ACP5QU_01395, partial [Anaerolineae bacterium]